MNEHRMDIGDFYRLAFFNCLSYFNRLGRYTSDRRQRKASFPGTPFLDSWGCPIASLK